MEEEGEDEDQDERRWRRKRMVISMRIDGVGELVSVYSCLAAPTSTPSKDDRSDDCTANTHKLCVLWTAGERRKRSKGVFSIGRSSEPISGLRPVEMA
jgi:hypothetical protein